MRTLILAAVLSVGVVGSSEAAPVCGAGTLAGYIALGSGGCSIGAATVADFLLGPTAPLATAIAPSDILVTPLSFPTGVGFDFSVDVAAVAPSFFDAFFSYSLSAPAVRSAHLSMHGADATPDGVATGVENLCLGSAFGPDPTVCAGSATPPLIVFRDGFSSGLADAQSFAAASLLGVFNDIAVDGGTAGTARLGTVTNTFSRRAIPEPATILLCGAGLLAVARRRRRARG